MGFLRKYNTFIIIGVKKRKPVFKERQINAIIAYENIMVGVILRIAGADSGANGAGAGATTGAGAGVMKYLYPP